MKIVSRLVDEHPKGVHAWLSLGPTLIGFYPLTGLINPFWGSLSGFPLYWAARGHPVYGPHPTSELLAFLLWPIITLAARTWVASKLVRWNSPMRTWFVVLWSVSALAAVPFDKLPVWFPGWPVYCACE